MIQKLLQVSDKQDPSYVEYILNSLGIRKKILSFSNFSSEILDRFYAQNHEIILSSYDIEEKLNQFSSSVDAVDIGWEFLKSKNQEKFLNEVNRVLRPFGSAYFLILNQNSIEGIARNRLSVEFEMNSICYTDFLQSTKNAGLHIEEVWGLSLLSKKTIFFKLLDTMAKIAPEIAECLVVKAKRIDQ